MAKRKSNRVDIRNRKATFDYELIEHFTAGIVLSGSEIKSMCRQGLSLVDSYCYFVEDELLSKYEYCRILVEPHSAVRTPKGTANCC